MIFLGDIAHPFDKSPIWAEMVCPWRKQPLVINLEGSLVGDVSQYLSKRVVYNHDSICDALKSCGAKVVNMANNHVMDIPTSFSQTLEKLTDKGFMVTGAGLDLETAGKPASIFESDDKYLFLGCGWLTIRCCAASGSKAGVNPFDPRNLLRKIKNLRSREPDAQIVLMPHWNYELELYPQPAHRQFAMAAIDAGANAVIGHHPHRVGGIEIYKGCPIAYSLGNWWMPHGQFFDGKLKFGDETLLQLALEWSTGSQIVCHWFEYNRDGHHLKYLESELLSDSKKIHALTSFSGMTHADYKKWFRLHRVKRKALPVYDDYRHFFRNCLKDWYVHRRHSALMILESTGLRKLVKR